MIGIVMTAVLLVTPHTNDAAKQKTLVPSTYRTNAGQQSTVTFDDGTRVTLAPDTRLRVTARVWEHSVELEGEAHFVVRPDRDMPFVVRTRGTTTRVLGAEFRVRHYTHESRTRVFVTSGKVSVSTRTPFDHVVTLVAGQGVDMSDSSVVAIGDRSEYCRTEGDRGR